MVDKGAVMRALFHTSAVVLGKGKKGTFRRMPKRTARRLWAACGGRCGGGDEGIDKRRACDEGSESESAVPRFTARKSQIGFSLAACQSSTIGSEDYGPLCRVSMGRVSIHK